MAHLERALESLRPMLLGSETWDYCVVWKLSDTDILRSIEWVNCFCVGGSDGESCMNSPTREGTKTDLCRDSSNLHPANKKSCLALAQFPFFMPLQPGIYGEVIVTSKPRWINLPVELAPNSFHETIGTRVLIPVLGGLVELFATNQILENQAIMEFVAAQFNYTIQSLECKDVSSGEERELLLGEYTNRWVDYFQQSDVKPSMINLLSGQFSNSSSGSIPSCLGPGSLSENSSPKDQYQLKQRLEFNVGCNTLTPVNEISDASRGEGKKEERPNEDKDKEFKSKNLLVERKRRARIQHGLCNLRSLVPKITKMSQTATLDDAIDHIVEMKKKVKDLQKELEELERDQDCNDGTKSKPSGSKGTIEFAAKLDASRQDPGSNDNKIHQVEVEVNQLAMRKFFVKTLCKGKAGGFTRLLETIGYMGLLVTEVNVTSCQGIASNSFVVEATNGEIQAGELRDVLMHTCG